MKKLLFTLGLVGCTILALNTAKADELTVTVDVKSGESVTKVVGADIYALVDDQLVEITVSPDKLPFKANTKFGALRLKAFWMTDKQLKGESEE